MRQTVFMKYFRLMGIGLVMLLCSREVYGAEEVKTISAGMTMPALSLRTPTSVEEQHYLGLKGGKSFTLSEVAGELVFVDILNVF
jgi:hypothetical protein